MTKIMIMKELTHKLKSHVKWLNDKQGGKRFVLIGANLNGANLKEANLNGARLDGTNLNGTDLTDASLNWADLNGASLNEANLNGVRLCGANLNGASLNKATLNCARLSGANLSGANLKGASLNGVKLSGANLDGTIGLVNISIVENLFTKILATIEKENERCDINHCMARYAINLAGDSGHAAELLMGTSVAGGLIIIQSCKYLNGKVPNFMASNEEAMTFIKACVEKEKATVSL